MDSSGAAGVLVEPPAPTRLIASSEPAALVEQLLGALRRGEISQRVGREVLVRLLPPNRRSIQLKLPRIVDAQSYAKACRRIMSATTSGKITPSDGAVLLRNAKAVFDATRADQRVRLLCGR
jgi:hypothetical protein